MVWNDFEHIKAIHVSENNKLIYEDMRDYDDKELFPVGCIFKAFLSALIGIAIKRGDIIFAGRRNR